MPRSLVTTLLLAAALLVLGCAGTKTDIPLEGIGSDVVDIPNAPAGDSRTRGAAPPPGQRPAAPLTTEQARALASRRMQAANNLWCRAEQIEPRNPKAAADLFEDIVSDYPEYEKAAEAKFRQGQALFKAHEYDDASEALQVYMRIAPVNPHLAEVEETIYESGRASLRTNKGFFAIFQNDDDALASYQFVAQTFPAGNYADDSLMALGDYYRCDGDFASSALHYKELLLRYPDSEWSFKARLRLGDSYFLRDGGPPYNAGFIDIDPREGIPAEQAKMIGPVVSAVELALEQYEIYLERMEADPARMAEYGEDVAYARAKRQECREHLAGKDLHRADWYSGCDERAGAISYWRQAAAWPDTQAGQVAARRLETHRRQVEERRAGRRTSPPAGTSRPPSPPRMQPPPAPPTVMPPRIPPPVQRAPDMRGPGVPPPPPPPTVPPAMTPAPPSPSRPTPVSRPVPGALPPPVVVPVAR